MKRQEHVLRTLMAEIDRVVAQHQSERDKAWLLAMIRSECWLRLLEFDQAVRTQAELESTSPLRYLEWVRRQQQKKKQNG